MKFFVYEKNYGFIVSEKSPDIETGIDLFFHFDDIRKTKLSREFLRDARDRFQVELRFRLMRYKGKIGEKHKAVDIELIKIQPKVES